MSVCLSAPPPLRVDAEPYRSRSLPAGEADAKPLKTKEIAIAAGARAAVGRQGSSGGRRAEAGKRRRLGRLPAVSSDSGAARELLRRERPFEYSTRAMERPDGTISLVGEYLEALIIAAIFLLFTNTFVVQTFYIPSGSMEDTLLIGDHLFVNRFIYGPTATAARRRAAVPRDPPRATS